MWKKPRNALKKLSRNCMPELPEVETIACDLSKAILRKTISSVEVIDPFVVKQEKSQFIARLVKAKVEAVERRGKALVFNLSSGDILVVQVMMTGQLVFNALPEKHTRVVFCFSDKTHLLYNDQRRFGHLKVVANLSEVNYFNILGPEPLTPNFSAQYLHAKLRLSTRPIKNCLLDHTVVAGIGNIYACEILFRAGISPKRLAKRISRLQAVAIYHHSVEVLNEAIQARGSSMRNYRDGAGQKGGFGTLVQVYGREDQPCIKCKKTIKRITQSGRSSFFCPSCQK